MPSPYNGGQWLDVLSFKKTKTGKTFAVRLGSAQVREDGSINVYFDALPIPDAEGCRVVIKPRQERQPARAPSGGSRFGRDDMEDEIPF